MDERNEYSTSDRLARLETTVEAIDHTLNGNGQAGFIANTREQLAAIRRTQDEQNYVLRQQNEKLALIPRMQETIQAISEEQTRLQTVVGTVKPILSMIAAPLVASIVTIAVTLVFRHYGWKP